MIVQINADTTFQTVKCSLNKDEVLHAAPDAMLCMSQHMRLSGRGRRANEGPLMRAIESEHFSAQRYQAQQDNAWAILAPALPGAVQALSPETEWMITASAFLAAEGTLQLPVSPDTLVSREQRHELRTFRFQGKGTLLIAGFGSIREYTLSKGESLTMDANHLLGWEAALSCEPVPSIAEEDFCVAISGQGRVLYQTSNFNTLKKLLS